MSLSLALAIGAIGASLLMSLVWLIQRRTGDAGIVDVAWGLGTAACGGFFALAAGSGPIERRVAITVLAALWAIRLSGYVLVRLLKSHEEDGRYRKLKTQWGDQAQARMFRFYQLQAFGCWLFALPSAIGGMNPSPWNGFDFVAIAIGLIAISGESLADSQLARFRANESNRGRVCRLGLWAYSRHPNYFFEWLHWWSYVFFAIGAPFWWLSILGPAAMYYFIRYVTGIPPTEANAIVSRGEAYRAYQREVSPFFPWFRRFAKQESSHVE